MRLQVLLWQDESANPDGYPALWPAQVYELLEEESALAPWIEMSDTEYDAYKEAHQSEFDAWYDAWNAAHPPQVPGDDI